MRQTGSDNRFEVVQKIANLGYWEFDHVRQKASWSHQMFVICGIDNDFPVSEEAFFGLIYTEDRDRVLQNFKLSLETKETLDSEFRIVRPNGEMRDVLSHISHVKDANDEVTITIGTIQDVTEGKRLQHRLTVEEQNYKSLFENNPNAVFSFDLDGRFLSCNSALEKMFGYSKEEIIGGSFHHFVAEESLEMTIHQFEESVRTRAPLNYDTTGVTKDGEIIEVNVTNIPMIINDELIGIYGIAKDITQQKLVERSLREAEMKYRSIVEQSLVGIFIAQKDRFVYTNKQLDIMMGYDTLIGLSVIEMIHSNDRKSIAGQISELGVGESLTDLCHRVIRRNGSIIICEVHYKCITHLGERAIIGTVLDITDRSKTEEQNHYLAYHDYLTQLPNRRMFEEELEKQLKICEVYNQKLAVLLLDLDRFKYINDTLGHPIGDTLLKRIADRLKGFSSNGKIAYRLGGDEFAIVITDFHMQSEVTAIVNAAIQLIKEPFLVEGFELNLTVSVGISQSPEDGQSVESLMKNADTALYYAKSSGRDQSQSYSSSLNVQTFKLFALSNDLRKALAKGELYLQYMPRVQSHSMKIVGVEALLRWNHPDWGQVSPAEFIPIAEETGLIVPIGEWVLREACKQCRKWKSMGLPAITVSVNFSVKQLLQQNILQIIDQVIEETGFSPDRLEIEITESSFISNEKVITELLVELRKRKIKVSLDDFGTGYSSLYLLKQLSLDTIKIDRSFVEEMLAEQSNKFIIQSIIQLALGLNMQVVAEGVETEEQFNYLRELRCDEIQGYYFSRPVNPEVIVEYLKDNSRLMPAALLRKKVPIINRRKYFRIELEYSIIAEMTISMFKGRRVSLGSTEVFVVNIGSGGLRFMVGVKLPVNSDILLKFKTQIMNQMYEIHGFIVWTNEIDDKIYEYGVQFQMKEVEHAELVNGLNILAIKQLEGILPQTQNDIGDPVLRIKELQRLK